MHPQKGEGNTRAKGARRALVEVELAVAVLVVLGAEGSDRVAAELPAQSARAEGQSD